MVDFNKLRDRKTRPTAIDPLEIFRRLPKPPGINDLYVSQANVLLDWFQRREEQDLVIKLHTGGGKTLVGLLLAQSSLNEKQEPALYLAPNRQLVSQILEKAKEYGIPAVEYQRGADLHEDFVTAKAVMVATYKALFNGRSKFGTRDGGRYPQGVGVIILDDAHVAFSIVRDSFTLTVDADEQRDSYESLTGLFRNAFSEVGRLGTFDDTVAGLEFGVLEVPHWAWNEKSAAVRQQLKNSIGDYDFVWPLVRDKLHLCHALISRKCFTITPILPFVDIFPTFAEAPRRVYMSATIADDTEILRTFDAKLPSVESPLSSRSLAGISERMILAPGLLPFDPNVKATIKGVLKWVSGKMNLGALLLVPSNKAAEEWSDAGAVAVGPDEVEDCVRQLQAGTSKGPFVFANRYDGIDLPDDSCRLLVMYGLPVGTADYELFRASVLFGGASMTRIQAQRIEQGMGRGARGPGDHCVILFAGADLTGWISKETNFKFLTSATRAQLEMGRDLSKAVEDRLDFASTMERSFRRDREWEEYHAETLAELVEDQEVDVDRLKEAALERKAFNLWSDSYPEKAISRIESFLIHDKATVDSQARGWLWQLAARIADHWGNKERAGDFQQHAFAENRNLCRPRIAPPYRPIPMPTDQERVIVGRIVGYKFRKGFLHTFDECTAQLVHEASSNQFEKALMDFGAMLGFATERPERSVGGGPDVLWLTTPELGLVIEAKSRKKAKNAFSKGQHGQLLVAGEWFKENYPRMRSMLVSVHPHNKATRDAAAGEAYALTYDKLSEMVSDARVLFDDLCSSQIEESALVDRCAQLLAESSLRASRLAAAYLKLFEVSDASA